MAIDTDQALETPRVLLLGASSQIGVFVIPQLILAGFDVLAVSRKGRPKDYPAFAQVEWLSEAEAMNVVHSCEYLLSAGPLDLAKKFLTTDSPQEKIDSGSSPERQTASPVTPGLTRSPFKTAVIFSSSSVETKQNSKNPNERSQIKSMLNLESELQLLAESNSTKLVIFRPTLIYGCGLDTNISRLASWITRFGFIPVNGKACGLRQPVHAEDLASAAVNALLVEETLPELMFLTGGETLSYSEMVTRIFSAMEKSPRLVYLPQWFLVSLIRLVSLLGMVKDANTEMVKRQQIDLVFDDHLARELLNYRPRPFLPTEADFLLPDFKANK